MKIEIDTKYGLGDIVTVVKFEMDNHGSTFYNICERKIIGIKVFFMEEYDYETVIEYLIKGGDYNEYGDEGREWMEFISDDNKIDLEGIYENKECAVEKVKSFEVKYKIERQDDKNNRKT